MSIYSRSSDHISGYVYLSLDAAFGKHPPTTYYPELQDEIWDGLISIDLYQTTGPEWEAFTLAVIERSQDPIWAPYILQTPNTSSIITFSGNLSYKSYKFPFKIEYIQIHEGFYFLKEE